jgi:hypothetical protein
MTRENTDGLFIDLGYYNPEDYLVYIAEGVAAFSAESSVSCDAELIPGGTIVTMDAVEFSASTTQTVTAGKIIQGAVEITDAFDTTLTAAAIRNSFALIDAVTNLESTANKTVDPGSLLEFFADLNSQANRFRNFDSALNSAADLNTSARRTRNSAANIETVAALSCDGNAIPIVSASAAISAAATLAAEGIEYRLRPNPYTRPNNWVDVGTLDAIITNEVSGYNLVTPGAVIVGDTVVGNRRLQNQNVNLAFQTATSSAGDFFVSFLYAPTFRETTDPSSILLAVYGINGDASWTISENRYITFGETYRTLVATLKKADGSTITLGGATTDTTRRIPNTGYGYWIQVRLFARGDGNNIGFNWRWMDGSTLNTTLDLQTTKFNFYTPATANQTLQLAPSESYLYDDFVVYQGTRDVKFRGTYGFQTGGYVPYYNDETFSVIYTPFDTNLNDITKLTVDPVLQFNSAFAQSVSALALKEASADLNVVIQQSTAATRIQQASADFDAVATQLTAAAKVGDFFVNADVTADLAIDPDIFKESSADLSSQIDQSTVAVKITSTNSALTVTASMQTDNEGLISGSAELVSTVTSTATVGEITQGAAVLTANSELSTVAIKAVEAEGAATAETQITVLSMRIRDTTADFAAVAVQLTAAAKTGVSVIAADVVAELSATAVVRRGNIIDLNSTTVASTEANKTAQGSVAITANSLFTIDAVVGVVAEGTLISAASILIQARADYSGTAAIQDAFSATMIAVANRTNEIDLQAQSNLVVQAQVTRTTAATINSTTTLSIAAGRRISAVANLPAISTVLAVGREIHIDQYVYIIPRESTAFTIRKETRDYSITSENKTYIIQGT